MDRIDLETVEHTVERAWMAQPVQDRLPVIRIGKLTDGRWWIDRCDGHRWVGAWACGDEIQAEAAAERWSRRTGLRWRRIDPEKVSSG